MGVPARRIATYQDILDLPEGVTGEILDGELYVSPRPASDHASAASVIGGELNPRFQRPTGGPGGPGGWWILYEPELHLDDDVIVPDLAGWRRERMPRRPREAFFTLVPDWVCEIQSPSSVRRDRVTKTRIYAEKGVEYLWLVDPAAKTLEVLRRSEALWQVIGLYAGDDPVRAAPFEAVELELARWWEE